MEYKLTVLVMLSIFVALDAIILLHSIRNRDGRFKGEIFFLFAVSVTLSQLFAVLTQLADPAFNRFGNAFVYFAYIGALTFMTVAAYFCFSYLRVMVSEGRRSSFFPAFLRFLPVLVILVTSLVSPLTHWIFYVDEQGVYRRGSLFILQIVCPYVYIILSLVQGFFGRKSDDTNRKRMLRFFVVYVIPSMLGVCIQMFIVPGGYSATGVSIGMMLMYLEIYISDINENKRLKSIESLNIQLQQVNEEQQKHITEIAALNAQLEENQIRLEKVTEDQNTQLEEISSLNSKLEAARAAAESASEAKTVFLNNMSHDIRTPLNAILGFSDLIYKVKNDPERVEDYLKKIKSSGEYLLSIINNVLDMARIESGRVTLENTFMDLLAEEDNIRSFAGFSVETSDHRFTIGNTIRHRYVLIDAPKYRQIMMNLISNAVKYTPKGGSIHLQMDELACDRPGFGRFRMTVSDTGIGMSPEYLEQIFDSFSREHNTTDSKIVGTGLGMSIVKKLVDLLGGTIEVESEKGKGSRFIVTNDLELADAPETYAGKKSIEATGTDHLAGKRILLTEDNDLNAEIATAVLEDAGFVVEHAENGVVCIDMLAKAAEGYYDLILMDIQMPLLNGYDAAKRIRESGSQIPIVAMTANAFEEDRRNAIASGMNGHLAKPIDVPKLMETIAGLLK